jgi:hypothetical protein
MTNNAFVEADGRTFRDDEPFDAIVAQALADSDAVLVPPALVGAWGARPGGA